MDYSRLCRGGGDGHLEALTGDNIDLIAAHLDVTYTVRLAACSRELYDMISKDEGKMHHWDEPCLLMPPPAYWFDEHWDVARASRLHDTVYDLVPLDHPRRSVALPFMHDRKWLGANGDWIAAADHHEWCLVNVYTERHIPLPSLPDSKIRHSIVSYRPAYSFNWRPEIYLLKIVICQVPTKGGRYADYKLIALFDKTIFYLEGGGDWRMLEALTPAPDYPNYCDAIELRGHVFAVDETDGSTYFWDTANENLMLPFVIPPPVVDDQQYAWFLAPSADGKRLMIILTVNKIGIANAEVPPDIPYAANGLQLRQYPPVATYVFELDPLSTARAGDFLWRQVNSLSDHSLFLGLNYPIIANLKKRESKAPDGTLVPFMRKNCVYTAYRNIRYNQYPKILRCNLQPDEGETVGVISLPKDGWDSARAVRNLWIGGVSPAISKQELQEEFQKFGKIEGVAFSRDQTSAYIDFEKLEDAISAHRALNGTDLGGKELCVDFQRSRGRAERSESGNFNSRGSVPPGEMGVGHVKVHVVYHVLDLARSVAVIVLVNFLKLHLSFQTRNGIIFLSCH
ncbi:hypothetical protein QYE76_042017 [Lolium multiflorum]|uniref:RRM domain-containing protein n=1 Tax=Lolium multiflorum TaxID=4521 RepID=A0AAD8WUP3_LOLMU|nr:hypothetical protein QYE76_042017 [Lolium multiflorum]